jgi:hypothetical protein
VDVFELGRKVQNSAQVTHLIAHRDKEKGEDIGNTKSGGGTMSEGKGLFTQNTNFVVSCDQICVVR